MIDPGGGCWPLTDHRGELIQMKKMMTLVLGLSLAIGAFTFAFGQDSTTKQTGKGGKKGSGKKGKDTTKS
jgi:hypothetical protein